MSNHRLLRTLTRAALALPVICSAIHIVGAASFVAAAPATSRPATVPAATDWYRQSAAAFLKSEAANRAVDLETIDQSLIAAALFHETNRVRADQKLPPLAHAPKLDASSAMHAGDMIAGDFFAHENELDKTKHHPIDRVQLHGYKPRFVAENLATAFALRYEAGRSYYEVPGGISYAPRGKPIEPHSYASFAQDTVQRWLDSPGHRANLLSTEATQLGNAVALQHPKDDESLPKLYAVQNFGDPMKRR